MAEKTLTNTSSEESAEGTAGIPPGIPLDGSRAGDSSDLTASTETLLDDGLSPTEGPDAGDPVGDPSGGADERDPAELDSLEEALVAESPVDMSDHGRTDWDDPAELDDIVTNGQPADGNDIDDPALAALLDGGHPEVDTEPDTSRFGDGSASTPDVDPFAVGEGPGFLDRVGSVGAPFSADQFPGKHTTSGDSDTPVIDDREGGVDGREGGVDGREGGSDNRGGGEDTGSGGASSATGSGSGDAGTGSAVGAVINAKLNEAFLGDEASNPVHEAAARDFLKGAGYEGVDQMDALQVRRNIDFEANRAVVDGGSTKPDSYTEDQWYGEGSEEIDQARADLNALRPQQRPQDGTIDPADGDVTTFGDGAPPDRSGISNPSGDGRTVAPEVDRGPQDDVIDPADDDGGPPVDGPWTDAPDIELDSGPIDAGIEYDLPPNRYAADQEPTETIDVE
ncbi:MAG: hypothetical protein OEQ47_19360 [Acidimicrobiia bacterium]|nr:hypothetical protein [Acidimicrobiia bacterium]